MARILTSVESAVPGMEPYARRRNALLTFYYLILLVLLVGLVL
jgi:hypothetical protein